MKLLKLSLATLTMAWCAFAVKAEDTKTPDAPKPVDAKPADTKPADTKPADAKPADAPAAEKPKTADAGDLVKVPEGTPPLSTVHDFDSFIGDISQGAPDTGKGKEKASKKAAKKGIDDKSLVLLVANHGDKKDKAEKGSKHGQEIILTATGDVLAQLTAFAEKHAHIKVTGSLTGDTMTVKEVSEAPADKAAEKKKKKNA